MHDFSGLAEALWIFAAAVVVVPLFQKIKASPILGYLVAGIVIGPGGLALIPDTETTNELAEFGVIFLMFAIGLELSIKRLRVMRRLVFGLGSMQVLITGLVLGAIASRFLDGVEAAVLVGGGIALSSTAMVTQLLVERGELASRAGRSGFAVLLLQDLAVVPLLALVPILGAESGVDSVGSALGDAAFRAVAALTLIVLFGRFVLQPVFQFVAEQKPPPELMTASTLLIVLGMAFATGISGLSLALGAFLAGLMLAETAFKPQVSADIQPFRRLLMGLFFMSVGMGIDLAVVADNIVVVLTGLVVLIGVKFVILTGLMRFFDYEWPISVQVGLMLAQGGEFAFVLFGLSVPLGIIPPETSNLLIAVIALSMVVTPGLVAIGSWLAVEEEDARGIEIEPEERQLRDHVVICGFGRVGQTVAKLLDRQNVSYLALDLAAARVRKAREKGRRVYFGDATNSAVLEAARADTARALAITLDNAEAVEETVRIVRHAYPHLPIVVRATDHVQARLLEASGATAAVPETLEASLQIGVLVMLESRISPDQAEDAASHFRHLAGELLLDVIPEDPAAAEEKRDRRRVYESPGEPEPRRGGKPAKS